MKFLLIISLLGALCLASCSDKSPNMDRTTASTTATTTTATDSTSQLAATDTALNSTSGSAGIGNSKARTASGKHSRINAKQLKASTSDQDLDRTAMDTSPADQPVGGMDDTLSRQNGDVNRQAAIDQNHRELDASNDPARARFEKDITGKLNMLGARIDELNDRRIETTREAVHSDLREGIAKLNVDRFAVENDLAVIRRADRGSWQKSQVHVRSDLSKLETELTELETRYNR